MIVIHKSENGNAVKINGEMHQAIVDKKEGKVFVFYQEKFMLTLNMEGRCLNREPASRHLIDYMTWNSEICWNPPHYVNNKRSCSGCEHFAYCQCSLHTEKFNFGVKKDANKTEGTGTELSNDCNENATHESKAPEGVQEQPS